MKSRLPAYIFLVAALSITAALSLNLFYRQRHDRDLADIRAFPHVLGDWKGSDMAVTEKEYRILETRNLILRKYVNSSGDELMLFIIYSETNRSVFHPPEVCLIGSGVEVLGKAVDSVTSGGRTFTVNRLQTQEAQGRAVIYYCYKAGALHTHDYYLQQAYFALQQFFGRRVKGATIRASVTIKNGDESYAIGLLKPFFADCVKILDTL